MTRSHTRRSSAPTSSCRRSSPRSYNASEPHYRPENVAKVEAQAGRGARRHRRRAPARSRLRDGVHDRHRPQRTCGDPRRRHQPGDDRTRRPRVRPGARSPCEVGDTGSVELEEGSFDVVTAYSFLHHLVDVGPTLATAATGAAPRRAALRRPRAEPGVLGRDRRARPRRRPTTRSSSVRSRWSPFTRTRHRASGSTREIFNLAEWGKTERGGSRGGGDGVRARGGRASAPVRFFYEWFVGQGQLINDPDSRP